jgi:hypothetical protein
MNPKDNESQIRRLRERGKITKNSQTHAVLILSLDIPLKNAADDATFDCFLVGRCLATLALASSRSFCRSQP